MTTSASELIQNGTGPILVRASAGSGKTYQLTRRFLHLLTETETDINQILALTFTDAAASEMKNRIYSALLNASESETDPAKKNRLLGHRLRFSSNRISTIHSFCQSVLKENPEALAALTFPLDPFDPESRVVRLDSGFSLIDAYSERVFMPKWRAEFLAANYDNPALARWLSTESTNSLETLFGQLAHVADSILLDQATLSLSDWQQLVATELQRRLDDYRSAGQKMLALAAKHLEIFSKPPAQAVSNEDWLEAACGLKKMKVAVLKKEWKTNPPVELDAASVAYTSARDFFTKTLGIPISEVEGPGVEALVLQIQEDAERPFGRLEFIAWQQMSDMAASGARWKCWLRYHRFAQRLIDHDDSILLTERLFKQFPEIAARNGSRFSHLMVDEFQDTDQTQWAIVKSILGRKPENSLLLVGDLKQAIYGFRGGEVSVMQQVSRDLPALRTTSLPASFRSNRTIVDFVNALFSRLMPTEEGAKAFEASYETTTLPLPPAEPQKRQLEPGAVRYLHLNTKLWRDFMDGNLVARIDQESDVAWEAARTAYFFRELKHNPAPPQNWKRISDLLKAGKPAIGILLRSKANLEVWANVFRRFGFSTAALSGGKFFSTREILDLYFLVSFLADRENAYALTALMRSPWMNLSDAALLHLRLCILDDPETSRRESWWAMLEKGNWKNVLDKTDAAALEAVLPFLKQAADDVRILRASDILLRLLNQIPVTAGYNDPEKAETNLVRACTMLKDQEDDGRAGLFELAEFLRINREEERDEKETPPAGETEVQIMTIHKSKGLEFPCVVLGEPGPRNGGGVQLSITPVDHPFETDSGKKRFAFTSINNDAAESEKDRKYAPLLLRRTNQLNDERELAETIRLFYVAVTRAESHFVLVNHENWTRETNQGFLSLWNPVSHDVLQDCAVVPPEMQNLDSWLFAGQSPFSAAEAEAILPFFESGNETGNELYSPALRETIETNRAVVMQKSKSAARKPVKTTESIKEEWLSLPGVDFADQPDDDDPRIRGTFIHRLLELGLAGHTLSERLVNRVLLHSGKSVTEKSGILSQSVAALNALWLKFPEARRFVSENAFLADFGEESNLVNGVADLLVEDASGRWWIVDYKTSPILSGFRDHAEKSGYFKQLEVYAEAYKSLFQAEIPPSRRLILYTFPEKPVWVEA